ncbi:Isochorismatase hydrolase [Stereum hirsutum FP-91666 SS1]|uniref:Isochorismatase hydrolase n=1 Tax=Stereum hirsutum (strain FP-91666) TaxID=721885 RepID=UPI000440A691|nr:Isochorismatase hydrolase [Stereum hirsutum FP-91666 SS1]EIM90928.1 Isochorismatase hydrolase [Stereum hirsutum FP-91666 SS1]
MQAPPNTVLLVIDAQASNFLPPPLGVPDGAILLLALQRVLSIARAARDKPLIIHTTNPPDFFSSPLAHAHTPLSSPPASLHIPYPLPLRPLPSEPVVSTPKNNAFSHTRLFSLIPPGPNVLVVVVGCQTDFCIRATCSAALDRRNQVVLVRGAHGTYDRMDVPTPGGRRRAAVRSRAPVVQGEIEAELEEAGVVLVDVEDVEELFG